jgi:hypothetical protein
MTSAVTERTTLRAMTAADLRGAVELTAQQSWPHRTEDWELFFELGEGLVAECDAMASNTPPSAC